MPSARAFVFAFLLFSYAAFAQTANTVFGAGYSVPVPIKVAPGQIVNLYVQGIGANLTQRVAAGSLPLPTILAGISVQLKQAYQPQSVAVPLLAVRPVLTCLNGTSASSGCGHLTVVTVQIPFELVVGPPCGTPVCDPAPGPSPQLVVSENGVAGGAIDVSPVADQVHVANVCDVDTSSPLGCPSTPVITHADGTLVSMDHPAVAGEEVVIWAFGLGMTKPAVPTGQATPSPGPSQFARCTSTINRMRDHQGGCLQKRRPAQHL